MARPQFGQILTIALLIAAFAVATAFAPSGTPPNEPQATATKNAAPRSITPLPVPSTQMGYGLVVLLNDSNVRRELALSDEQVASLATLGSEYARAEARSPVTTDDAPDSSDRQEGGGERDTLRAHFGSAATKLLSAAQQRRLNEIMFQLRSIDIFRDAKFLAALDITDQQARHVTMIRKETERILKQLRLQLTDHTIDRGHYEDAVHAALAASDRETDNCLTIAQRRLIAEWRGEHISFGRMHLRLVLRGKPSASSTPLAQAENERR